MDHTRLSKDISYALRHAPQEYDLVLDEQGWANVEDLIAALLRKGGYSTLAIQDIADMIQLSEKKRHEIKGGRVRALYGHSTAERIHKEAVRPPDVLYHGTTQKALPTILEQGLIAKSRQYVHLSQDQETAVSVGKRRDRHPVVLRIDALAAWEDGVKFYHGNVSIWLADTVPAKYLEIDEPT